MLVCDRTTAKAPLISISAIVGELPEELEEYQPGSVGPDEEVTPDTSSDCALMSEPLTQAQSLAEEVEEESEPRRGSVVAEGTPARVQSPQQQPAREPDARAAQQPGPSDPAAAAAPHEQQRDNNVNEVCPWEDE